MAELVEALAKANVAAIGFDFLFSETDRPTGDLRACAAGAGRGARPTGVRGAGATATPPSRRPSRGVRWCSASFSRRPTTARRRASTTKAGFSFVGDPPTDFVDPFQRRAGADPRTRRRGGRPRLSQLAAGQRPRRPPRAPAARRQRPAPAEPGAGDAAGRAGRHRLRREVDDRLPAAPPARAR